MENKRLILAVVLVGVMVVLFGVLMPLITGKGKKDGDEGGKTGEEKARIEQARAPGGLEAEEEDLDEWSEEDLDDWDDDEEEDDLLEAPVESRPVDLTTDLFSATLSTRGGAIRSFTLTDPRYVKEKQGGQVEPIDIVSRSISGKPIPLLTLHVKSDSGPVDADLDYEVVEESARRVVFTAMSKSWKIRRTFHVLDEDYKIESTTEIKNISRHKHTIQPQVVARKFMKEAKAAGLFGWIRPQLNIVKGMCMLGGDMERMDIKKVAKKGGIDRLGHVDYVAVDDLYFVASILPLWEKLAGQGPEDEGMPEVRCRVESDGVGGLKGTLDFGKSVVKPGETIVLPARAYLGPKEYETLEAAGSGLGKVVDYGWFGGLARFLYVILRTFVSWVHNWAIAIIMLTILVKLVLSPLTHWSFKSMQKMQAIKPLIDDLNARYPEAEDRDKKNQALMALYRTHKINPLMGCLPMLLQMPIWIALYRMLANSVELYRTPLILWIEDLSQPDPYYVLPLVLGGSMFLQQKLTPTTPDSQQAKMMMYMMPIMFTVFMLFLPAGLNLYILVNTVLTIAQQKLLYKPKVVTAEASKVQLMSEMDPGEIDDKRKARKEKDKKTPKRKRGSKGRRKK